MGRKPKEYMKPGLYHLKSRRYLNENFGESSREHMDRLRQRIAGAQASAEGIFEVVLPVTILIPRGAVFNGDEYTIHDYIKLYMDTILMPKVIYHLIRHHKEFVEVREQFQNNAWQLRAMFELATSKGEQKAVKSGNYNVKKAALLISENEAIVDKIFKTGWRDEETRKDFAKLGDIIP